MFDVKHLESAGFVNSSSRDLKGDLFYLKNFAGPFGMPKQEQRIRARNLRPEVG